MLDTLFLQILNMSFTASIVIFFVLLVRLLLKKVPKIFSYSLWSVVLFRLVCPFSFDSVFSLLPVQSNAIPPNIGFMQLPQIDTGIPIINESMNSILPEATHIASVNPLQIWIFLGRAIWLVGIAALLIYSIVSLLKLRRRLGDAVQESGNIYTSASLTSPFVMGLFRPKIYLPAHLAEEEKRYIVLHEQTHIRRLDHVVKIVSFFVLCVHWFNPLVWLAFFLSGRDMELSCDEAVIKKLGSEVKKDYSSSLLSLATGRRIVGGTPLAFGEGDTKSRIKNVLNYKKPAFWVIVVSVIAIVAVGIGLAANPKSKMPPTLYAYSEYGVIPMNIGTYSWNGVAADAISYTEMNYENAISYNEGRGHRNANIFFSTSNTPSNFNSDNAKGTKNFEIAEMKRYVNGKEEVLSAFDRNFIEVSLETEGSYLYEFKVRFGENYAYYSVKINNTVSAAYTITKHDQNGEVIAESTAENQELAQKIMMDGMVKSTIWEGVDVGQLEEYYHIRRSYPAVGEVQDCYAFRLADGKAAIQFGIGGMYTALSDELFEKLEKDVFFPDTAPDVQPKSTNYLQSLTAEERKQTEEVVRAYFTDEAPYYEGVVSIEPMPNESILYQNTGTEAEYAPGNIIIYKLLTGRDRRDKTPERSASVARTSKDAPWELINQGY